MNNEVCGPYEKEKLSGLANFSLSSLICPETPAGGQTSSWKEASAYPEVLAALSPAPAKPRVTAAESPLELTMRGSLISVPEPKEPAIAPSKALPEARPEPIREELDQLGARLASMADNQSRLLKRLDSLESAVADLKALLFPKPPKGL
ncbi:MAG: hypothetical protein COT18_12470 [Elusimicrobia bacterium CG08_land_8_20_14_0_20_59_10]|nr:MAG: hypothetical protein COT18_12470 [Elusimicrobia bacterium CG08_land_8_20_14_0_20_59_10]